MSEVPGYLNTALAYKIKRYKIKKYIWGTSQNLECILGVYALHLHQFMNGACLTS